MLAYDYPTLQVRIDCGSGTYVRSLGRDLAESLGNGAVYVRSDEKLWKLGNL